MAVGLERAYAKLLGQGQGLLVGGLSLLDVRGIAIRGNLTEEPQRPRLEASLLAFASQDKGALGMRSGRRDDSRWRRREEEIWDTLRMRAIGRDDIILDGVVVPDQSITRVVAAGATEMDCRMKHRVEDESAQ